MKPRIGITSGLARPDWGGDGRNWLPYAEAVERAGGEAIHLSAETLGREREVLRDLEGILFSGGRDVDLRQYPNPPDLTSENPEDVMSRFRMDPEPDRDIYEIPLLQAAVDADLPVLGICRGCQVMAVALGGRLILDIPLQTGTPLVHSAAPEPSLASSSHMLEIAPEGILAELFAPGEPLECNSRHHQSVSEDEHLPLVVRARSPVDGIVEAVELPGRRWVLGVQWHPEHRRDDAVRERCAPLFSAFIAAAAR